jgi:undecaprenol kinase
VISVHHCPQPLDLRFVACLGIVLAGLALGVPLQRHGRTTLRHCRSESSITFHESFVPVPEKIRIQLVALLAIVLILAVYRPEAEWWALVGLASTSVISAELLNTAIEHLADHLHPEVHPTIRVVKDCAAGAVLLASLGAVVVAVALIIHLVR